MDIFRLILIFKLQFQPITDTDKQTTCAHGTAVVITQAGWDGSILQFFHRMCDPSAGEPFIYVCMAGVLLP